MTNVLVIGGSRGIGKSIVREFGYSNKYDVYCTSTTGENADYKLNLENNQNEIKLAIHEIIKDIKLALQECGRLLGTYVRKKYRISGQIERANMFEKYIPEVADSLSVLSGDKKEKILQGLQKMLVKPEIKKEISEEGDADDKLYRMEFSKSQENESSEKE